MTSSDQAPTPSSADGQGRPWLDHYPQGIDWHQKFEPKPLYEVLDGSIARFGSNICTEFIGKTLTYSQIGDLVSRAAAGLRKLGVEPGVKVGLFLPNSPTFIVYYFAVMKAGGIVVNYNPLYTVEELAFQVEDSQTDLMVTLDLAVLFDKVEGLLQNGTLKRAVVCSFPALLPGLKSTLFKLLKRKELAKPAVSAFKDRIVPESQVLDNDGALEVADVNVYEDVAVLQYTGGTTGTPKGAMLTHANLHCNVDQLVAWAPQLEEGKERVLGVLPFFHVFAMTTIMNFGVAIGAHLILMPRFVLDDALKLIDGRNPTIMPGVPTLYNAMMNHPQIKNFNMSSLKLCLSGGAPLPLEVKRGFEGLTGCKLVEGYGLSETSPVATANPLDGRVKEGSIGLPIPGTTLSMRDPEAPDTEMPIGQNGEICISGPQVMKGYWNKPGETENVFVGDFLRTGDVGYMDEEGFTFIVDRIKDLIICSGYNVYPRRVEEAIYTFPAVEEVTVIGIKDEYRGEAPKAFIKLRAGMSATAEDIMAHLAEKLSKIELPEQIEFRDGLPKTMIGKLSKKELQQEEADKASA